MKILAKGVFLVGIVVSMMIALFPTNGEKLFGIPILMGLIILLGIVVGTWNLTRAKTNNFLITTVILLILGNAGLVVADEGVFMAGALMNVLAFIAPSAVLVGIKAASELIRNA